MKKNCKRFVEDIAVFASDTSGLSTEAAAHVHNCGTCREKIAQLTAVAAMHREGAANLVEPKRRLSRPQLERVLASGGRRMRDFEIRWRTVLAGVVALALIIGGVVTHRPHLERPSHQSKHDQGEKNVEQEAFEPTMLALHQEVESGRELMLSETVGPGIRHYRVRDVESELRN